MNPFELSYEDAKMLLTDAIEVGAIQYWCYIDNMTRDGERDVVSCWITTQDDNDKDMETEITPQTIQGGTKAIVNKEVEIAEYIRKQVLTDNLDSEGLDCIVQAGIFGKVIYG